MSRASLAALALALAATSAQTTRVAPQISSSPRLVPLANRLAAISAPELAPPGESSAAALARLGAAIPVNRQQLRWSYALALLAERRPDEARGVLTVMALDEPDLRLVPAWRLAAGRAAAELDLFSEAVALLDDPHLAGNAEACVWRLDALAALGAARSALAQLPCAKAAIAARPAERAKFLDAAAGAALAIDRPDAARHYLRFAPARHPRTRLLEAEALLRENQLAAADRILAKLASRGDEPTEAAAEILRIEAAWRRGNQKPAALLKRAEALRLRWRGDAIEQRATSLSWDLALVANKPQSALAAASTLLRYHPAEPRLPAMLSIVAGNFRGWLSPGSKVPLPLAAGLMWDYRDLLPNGAAGDSLVRLLADRLAGEGLHARAADILEHQLLFRAHDLAQGPLSVDIAQLRLLAGQPDKAEAVIRSSANILYPEPFAGSRARLEAIALFQLGRTGEALALLGDMPGNGDLREELLWRAHNWDDLARAPLKAPGGKFDPVTQVRLLRRAIALAMLGDEAGLAKFRARYSAGFANLPTASAFAALSGAAGTTDGPALAAALAALPSVSPAGDEADLIDLSDAAFKARRAPPSSRG